MVATLDGRYRRTLHDLDIEAPTSMALDPESGVLFWTDIGINPKVRISAKELNFCLLFNKLLILSFPSLFFTNPVLFTASFQSMEALTCHS